MTSGWMLNGNRGHKREKKKGTIKTFEEKTLQVEMIWRGHSCHTGGAGGEEMRGRGESQGG